MILLISSSLLVPELFGQLLPTEDEFLPAVSVFVLSDGLTVIDLTLWSVDFTLDGRDSLLR